MHITYLIYAPFSKLSKYTQAKKTNKDTTPILTIHSTSSASIFISNNLLSPDNYCLPQCLMVSFTYFFHIF